MYTHILVATDGSELASRALDHALGLAKALGSAVAIVTVTEPAAVLGGGYATVAGTAFDPIPELIEAQETAAKELLAKAQAAASAAEYSSGLRHGDDGHRRAERLGETECVVQCPRGEFRTIRCDENMCVHFVYLRTIMWRS